MTNKRKKRSNVMAFCQACGNEVLDTAVVCMKCGSAVKAALVADGEKWNTGTFTGLVIASFIIPLIGLGAGIYGVCKESKRGQGGILIGAGVIGMILWSAITK